MLYIYDWGSLMVKIGCTQEKLDPSLSIVSSQNISLAFKGLIIIQH
jgi:hypothetical protein